MLVSSLFGLMLLVQASTSGASPKPPALRLGNSVIPIQYALELKLDPDRENFSGFVKVDVDVREPLSLFWVNAAPNLTIQSAELEAGGKHFKAHILPGGKDFAGFQFDSQLPAGPANLHMEFTGTLELKSSNGLFRGKVADLNYIYTQFEPIAARMAFPCFDEPAFKVPWQVTLEMPSKALAFSNTPIEKEEPAGAMRRVTFARTKPLPSYLVAFAVGPFDVVDAGTTGRKKTPVRLIVPHGRAADAEYAKQVTPGILAELEKYFDVPYPYEKLDEVAIPLFGGAMENPGLVTYADTIILSPPKSDSIGRQREYFITAAHELAHQWFGDLVTMAWWNDTWLNESFATWMESQITDRVHPEWRNRVEEIDGHLAIMRQDSLLSARRVRQPVESNDDIENSFDGITYIKGGGVIRMLETWMGEKAFQKGVHYHMTHHAFQNATAEDFFASLATATKLPVAAVASTFIDQSGVPQVDVALGCPPNGPASVKLSQKRFLPLGTHAPDDRSWKIPVCLKFPGGRECSLLDSKESSVPLAHVRGCPAWILANPGLGGYYHVRYSDDLLQHLIDREFDQLDLSERVALVGDTSAMTLSGAVKPSQALALAARVKDAPEHELVDVAIEIVESIDRMVTPALRPNYERYVESLFGERARKLGWLHRDGDSAETKLLRHSIVDFVVTSGKDAELIAQAKTLAGKWLDDHNAISRDMTSPVLTTAIHFGDRELFERMLTAAKSEKDHVARAQMIRALGSTRDPKLIEVVHELYLNGPFDSRETWPLLFAGRYPISDRIPFDFVRNNIDVIEKKVASGITGGEGNAALIGVAGGFCSEAGRKEAEEFFSPRAAKYTGGPRTLEQTLERIHQCAVRVEDSSPDVAAFLSKQ